MTQTPTDAELMTMCDAVLGGSVRTGASHLANYAYAIARALKARLAQGEAQDNEPQYTVAFGPNLAAILTPEKLRELAGLTEPSPTTPSQARDELTREGGPVYAMNDPEWRKAVLDYHSKGRPPERATQGMVTKEALLKWCYMPLTRVRNGVWSEHAFVDALLAFLKGIRVG